LNEPEENQLDIQQADADWSLHQLQGQRQHLDQLMGFDLSSKASLLAHLVLFRWASRQASQHRQST